MHQGAATAQSVHAIEFTFSEEVNPIDANAPANYELRRAVNGGFGDGDDVIFHVLATHAYDAAGGISKVTLDPGLGGIPLPADVYRITVHGAATSGIHDTAGLLLDGDGDGAEGGDYVRTFEILPPEIRIDDVTVQEGDPGGTEATFTLSLSAAVGHTVTVDYATVEGTAESGKDYLPSSDTLTFKPGQTELALMISIPGDTQAELEESFSVRLSDVVGATTADDEGVCVIVDDDQVVRFETILVRNTNERWSARSEHGRRGSRVGGTRRLLAADGDVDAGPRMNGFLCKRQRLSVGVFSLGSCWNHGAKQQNWSAKVPSTFLDRRPGQSHGSPC